MLVKDNQPVCESITIIEYMDEKLDGKNKLLANQPDEIKQRYQRVRALHEAWLVEEYTFGAIQRQNWFFKQIIPVQMLRNRGVMDRLLRESTDP